MEIITAITTAISTLKTGYEIKKLAGNLDSEVQQSELRVEIRKLQESLIDVQSVLLSAKEEILNNREFLRKKENQIAELEDLLKFKNNLIYDSGVYINKTDKYSTDPYCSHCWEVNKVAVHLNFKNNVEIEELYGDSRTTNLFICPSCKNEFNYP